MPIVAVRVTEPQARELREKARRKKITVSDYLRNLAFPSEMDRAEPRITGRPGRVIIHSASASHVITSEEVKEILEEMS